MKREKMYDGITGIRDELVEKTEQHELKERRRFRRKRWTGAIAAVLVMALLGGVFLHPRGNGSAAYAISEAQYPEMAPYPNENDFVKRNGEFDDEAFDKVYTAWRDSMNAQRREDGYADGLEQFFAASAQQFLTDTKGGNLVYSPLNVYMALGMLAEVTDGNSRQQILNVLGSASIESLRRQAADVWNAVYRKDGAVSSVLASSLWLNQDVTFQQAAMDALAEHYYASSYRGEMGSAAFDRALQSWLNEQTGGLLRKETGGITLSPETILALATTVWFQAKWSREFNESKTEPGVFHAVSGEQTVDFMHQGGTGTYYWAEQFGAVGQHLENGGEMWLILPDEGVAPEQLLSDCAVMELVQDPSGWADQKTLIVNRAIPKFDVTSQLDLRDGLQAMGITDVFDAAVSDFTPMTGDTDEIFLSQVQHDVRVTIDEEGVTAAAYTVMATSGSSMPPEDEMDFVVDRPFLFAITSGDGLPLFVGVVHQPG